MVYFGTTISKNTPYLQLNCRKHAVFFSFCSLYISNSLTIGKTWFE